MNRTFMRETKERRKEKEKGGYPFVSLTHLNTTGAMCNI